MAEYRSKISDELILDELFSAGLDGDYARARRYMKRHSHRHPKWRMQKAWADGVRAAYRRAEWNREAAA